MKFKSWLALTVFVMIILGTVSFRPAPVNADETISVSVIVKWDGAGGNPIHRPDEICVDFNSNSHFIPAFISAEDGWAKTFNLPKYNNGGTEAIYSYEVRRENNPYTYTFSGSIETGLTVHPTKIDTYETPVSVIWDDNGQSKLRPDILDLETTPNVFENKVQLIRSNSWTTTLFLPKKDSSNNDIAYTGVMLVDGLAEWKSYDYSYSGDVSSGYTITARLKKGVLEEKVTAPITVEWHGENGK
ncbi:MAG: Cna B-type domain-containing protein [Eubacteriales bacterium]|nr:Cna B-type domain-containing protein [Eubacteriales bacterium]